MKLSIFTTTTRPNQRGDNWRDALECYKDLADEVVNVSGDFGAFSSVREQKIKIVRSVWPQEFDWSFFGKQFQKGYDACTGDWVIKTDLDYIFHEKDFAEIREVLERHSDFPALSFYKYQFVLPDRYNLKSRLVVAVNKKVYGDRIRFDSGGDLCQVSLDGKYLSPDAVPDSKIGFYNYEKILKTKEQIANDAGRMERAWKRHFGHTQYRSDGTNEGAYNKWYEAQKGKLNKPQQEVSFDQHPKYVQDTIKNLKPENFGYNGFGLIEGKVYA